VLNIEQLQYRRAVVGYRDVADAVDLFAKHTRKRTLVNKAEPEAALNEARTSILSNPTGPRLLLTMLASATQAVTA
jgi:hypothetical protein